MAGRPPRILLFPDANFLAHVSRLLEVGKALRDGHGADVAFAGDGPFLALAREAGFRVLPCFTVPREQTLGLARRAALVDPIWWHRVVARSIRSDVEVLTRERPDVAVGDMHWSLRASAAECGVPYVSLVNAAWTNHLDHRLQALDGHVVTRLLGRRLATASFPFFTAAALWFWAWPYKLWRQRHRAAGVRTRNLFDVVEGDLTLLADVPEFAPTRELPATVRYVGPILWQAKMAAPGWLSGLSPERPTIYVTMGSTGDRRLFDTAVEAFAGREHQVLMTTGGVGLARTDLPPNVFVADYAPGSALMARADVCVNHGGNGTIYQALGAGVPVVGVPHARGPAAAAPALRARGRRARDARGGPGAGVAARGGGRRARGRRGSARMRNASPAPSSATTGRAPPRAR